MLKGQYWKHADKRLLCNYILGAFKTLQTGLLTKKKQVHSDSDQVSQSVFVLASKCKCLSPNSSPVAPPAAYAMQLQHCWIWSASALTYSHRHHKVLKCRGEWVIRKLNLYTIQHLRKTCIWKYIKAFITSAQIFNLIIFRNTWLTFQMIKNVTYGVW